MKRDRCKGLVSSSIALVHEVNTTGHEEAMIEVIVIPPNLPDLGAGSSEDTPFLGSPSSTGFDYTYPARLAFVQDGHTIHFRLGHRSFLEDFWNPGLPSSPTSPAFDQVSDLLTHPPCALSPSRRSRAGIMSRQPAGVQSR